MADPDPTNGKRTKVPLPFEDAIRAALDTPPEPEESKPFGKRTRREPDRQVPSKKK